MADENTIDELEDEIANEIENILDEDIDDDELDEMVKSSMGDPSEIDGPVKKSDTKNKSSIKMKSKASQAKLKGVETKSGKMESKYAIINNLIAEMQKMNYEDVVSMHNKLSEESFDDEVINVEEEITNIFGDENLSEEFRSKAATIFEAAVGQKVNELFEDYMADAAKTLTEERETMRDELVEKVDSYLDYVITEWADNNKLAIETGIREEVVESFMGSLKNMLEEHYIEVPEDKIDVVESLTDKVSELEEELNTVLIDNMELNGMVAKHEKNDVVKQFAESLQLVDTDVEKLQIFAESIEAKNADEFSEKLNTICEHYFAESVDVETGVNGIILNEDTDPFVEDLTEENKIVDPRMQQYVTAISKAL